jgi:formylglycine-generating enzyme required for sulfatase activity
METRLAFSDGPNERMRLKTLLVLSCLAVLAPLAASAQPVVSNVRAAQRAGTQLVDIYYDLASASNSLFVSVMVSTNGGANCTLPATSFTGAVGAGVAPGINQKITWNAGADWPTNFSSNVRFRVTADDANVPSGMALIPAGTFTMGNCMDPNEGDTDELPLHAVYVSAFYMDKFDVTLALWQQVFNWATNHGYSFDNPGSGKAANHPVQTVDWYDCVKWCNARSEMEGRIPAYYTDTTQITVYRTGDLDLTAANVNWNAGYRLPTEAEWEKAARGGLSGERFPWGKTISWIQANYAADPEEYSYDVNPASGYDPVFNDGVDPYTSPVDYFAVNGYGLYDMAGNVFQWCWDWYGNAYYSSSPGNDPSGPSSGNYRIVRGGSWFSYPNHDRCAFRVYVPSISEYLPVYADSHRGFRPALPHSGLPAITVQPQNQRVHKGDNVAFTVTATGDAPLYYQWLQNGTNIVSGTGASLTLTNVQSGTYYISVVVNNAVGVVTSRSAQLLVSSSGIGEQ